MNHDPYSWGRPSNETYGNYSHAIASAKNNDVFENTSNFPKMNSQQPIITTTSVLAIKFNGGIIMAADTMGSYGSLMRFNNVDRLIKVGAQTVVGISGDVSDLQQIERILEELETEQEIYDNDGGHNLRAPHVHEYISRVMYNRRTKVDPLWNSIIVGGFNDDGTSFLRYVDLLGVTYGSSCLATGFGKHLAVPLMRQLIPSDPDYVNVTEEQAKKVIMDSMRVLFYRDARSLDKFSLVTLKGSVGAEGVGAPAGVTTVDYNLEKDIQVTNQSWRFAHDIKGYGSVQE